MTTRKPGLAMSMLCVTAMLGFTALPAGDEAAATDSSAQALEILKKADAAIKQVHAVRYTGKAVPTGVAENFRSRAEGQMLLVGWNDGMPQKFLAHVKTVKPGTAETIELTGGGDGDSFFLIDHGTKKGYEDMDPAVLGTGGNALQGPLMAEFVHDHPFDDELEAETRQYLGTETVDGVECHKIRVAYSGGRGESQWLFSTKDYLPRRRVQIFSIPGQGDGTLEITVSGLEVNPEIEPSAFKMKLPGGYQRIDDFAP